MNKKVKIIYKFGNEKIMAYNILLVDDDEEFRYEFSCCFDEYNIIEASNGREALYILSNPNEIDLVILDVLLPGTKGTKILLDIKDMIPDMKVIILTGYSSKEIAIDSLKGKADDYFEKPLNINLIKDTIRNMLINKNETNLDINSVKNKIERIKYFIKRNPQKIITLKEVSDIVFVSSKNFSRMFKNETGICFKDYIIGIKIEQAKKLLSETDLTVYEIAYKIGYLNPESFNRLFKKITNSTPMEYRSGIRISKKEEK